MAQRKNRGLQGVNINDKHIETIAHQMMRWVTIEDVGDTRNSSSTNRPTSAVDHLRRLKENVTMGRLIPAGTGFEY